MYLDEVYLYKEWPFAQHHQVILDLFLMIPRLPNVHLSGMKFVGSLYALVYAEYFFGKKKMCLLNAVIYWKMCVLCMNYLAGFCSSKILVYLLWYIIYHILYIYINVHAPPIIIHRLVGPLPMEQSRFFWASRWWGKKSFWLGEFTPVDWKFAKKITQVWRYDID